MIREGLTFDDVLLIPHHSTVESRSTVDISIKMNGTSYKHPIIPANMKTIAGLEMTKEVVKSGGLAIVHRFMSIEEQKNVFLNIIHSNCFSENFELNTKQIALSIGIKNEDKKNIKTFYSAGVRTICIDIAHGDSIGCINMISWIKKEYPDIFIIAGNVATGSGARNLWEAGADAVKVGVGPGSLCTTRIETGNGVPQLTALMDVALTRELCTTRHNGYVVINEGATKHETPKFTRPLYIISDGGIKSSGDIVKALCFADMVMIGNMFAGCVETPGSIIAIDGREYKEYVGSSTHKANHVEGVAALVPTKGRFKDVLTKMLEGLRSGCSYQGAHNLTELKDEPQFIKITNAGLVESHPHDVRIVK